MNNSQCLEAAPRPSRFTRRAGEEPIDRYRLLTPLGVGGFGEVWKCLAPGNLLKAMKIVTLPGTHDETQKTPAKHEEEAINRVREIRHPFLISVERVERIGDELFIVMELADSNLMDEFEHCRRTGLPGIPDDQLLHNLLEAAEVLDVMNFQHGLQHLDVKPANLLICSRHVKLADFGLVSEIADQPTEGRSALSCCFTPRYASPELLQGKISRTSDQYSLAVVYQELLTGELPFEGNGLLKRLLIAPDLAALPEADQPLIARALSADPEKRFPSCLEFINALLANKASASRFSRVISFNSLAARKLVANTSCDSSVPPHTPAGKEDLVDTPWNHGHPATVSIASPSRENRADTPTRHAKPPVRKESHDRQETTSANDSTKSGVHASSSNAIYPPTIHVSDLKWRPDSLGEAAPRSTNSSLNSSQAKRDTFNLKTHARRCPVGNCEGRSSNIRSLRRPVQRSRFGNDSIRS